MCRSVEYIQGELKIFCHYATKFKLDFINCIHIYDVQNGCLLIKR